MLNVIRRICKKGEQQVIKLTQKKKMVQMVPLEGSPAKDGLFFDRLLLHHCRRRRPKITEAVAKRLGLPAACDRQVSQTCKSDQIC